LDKQIPAEQRVSYHAVTRYVQRMLGIFVDVPEDTPSKKIALQHCAAAGTTIAEVRAVLIPPAVLYAIVAGFKGFRYGGIEYTVTSTGIIATIYPTRDRPVQRMKMLTEREQRQEMARFNRRQQQVSKLRARLEDATDEL
jgi:hypothetical protein